MSDSQRPSCCELFGLFCCPPLPSAITNKLFFNPVDPSYAILAGENGEYNLVLTESAEFQYTNVELQDVEVFKTQTSKGHRIACMYVKCTEHADGSPIATPPKYTLLFSGGNRVDLGILCSFFIGLGRRLGVNICAYDYSGHGCSEGKPSEKNCYADVEAVWDVLTKRYNTPPEKILIYGQNFGTSPSVHIAAKYPCAGVVLESPLSSGVGMMFPGRNKTCCFNPFPNIAKAAKISSPVLIIHAVEDEYLDFGNHGLTMYDSCLHTVEPLWLEGIGQGDVVKSNKYLPRLRKFLYSEIIYWMATNA